MEFTWISIAASLMMGLGAVSIFVFAARRDYFRDLEDVKYQVFWSDLEELMDEMDAEEENLDGDGTPGAVQSSGCRGGR